MFLKGRRTPTDRLCSSTLRDQLVCDRLDSAPRRADEYFMCPRQSDVVQDPAPLEHPGSVQPNIELFR